MLNKRTLSRIGLALLALGLIAVFGRVLEMRISGGNIYPHYSTLRNDPIGSSAIFDSFASLEGYSVGRNLTPLTGIKNLDGDTALLLLGLPWDSFKTLRAKDNSPVLRAVEDDGARLVITLNPKLVPDFFRKKNTDEEDDWFDRRRKLRDKLRKDRKKKEEEKSGSVKKKKENKEDEDEDEDDLTEEERKLEEEADEKFGIKLNERLAVEIPDLEDFQRPDEGWKTKPGKTLDPSGVPAALPFWFSQYRLKPNDKVWKKVVMVDESPVVLERRLGKGSIVLATDSYFASNESLHGGGNPEFLLWMAGGKSRLIFDETIHGSVSSGGAMKLIRRYRLHGFFIGMFLFIGLWAWRSATSLTPGDESVDRGFVEETAVSGEQSNSGFIQLLKRSIPGKELISQCVDVWKKSQHSPITSDQEKKLSGIIASHEANPRKHSITETYQAISKVLKKH